MKIRLNYFIWCLCALILYTLTLRVEATNYYVDGINGNDSNNGLTQATAWKTLLRVSNNRSFQAGDIIAIRDSIRYEGGLYFTDNGTSNNPIIITNWYGSASGRKPVVKASNTVTNFTNVSGNIWSASYIPLTGLVNSVWFEADQDDPTQTKWGIEETSQTSLTADYEWYWASNNLYIYSTTDPNTRFQYVEAECQTAWNTIFAVFEEGNYVTIENLDVRYARGGGIRIGNNGSNNVIIQDCKTSFTGLRSDESAHGIENYNGYNNIIRRNECFENSNHGIYIFANLESSTTTNIIVDSNLVYDNKHSQIDINTNGGHLDSVICRYNTIKNNVDTWSYTEYGAEPDGFFIAGQFTSNGGTTRRVYIMNNVAINIKSGAIDLNESSSDLDYIYIYNNTFYDDVNPTPATGYRIVSIYNSNARVWFRNNIVYSTATKGLIKLNSTNNKVIDHNLYYYSSSVTEPFYGNTPISTFAGWLSYTGQESGSYNSNPNFINPPLNLSLDPGDAIDNGFTIPVVVKDRNGVSRPQGSGYDIGAYESIAGGGGGGNSPPNQPADPGPANGAINQSVNTTLMWSCSDPDGDPLTYNVYFGNTNHPPLVAINQSNTSYSTGQLDFNSTYYWKIVAKDNHGASTAGTIWSFSTKDSGSGAVDVKPPKLTGVQSVQSSQVLLYFSEPLDSSSATIPGNYLISDQIEVLGAALSASHKRIILTTNQQVVNHIYTIDISNVTDTAGNVISSQANSAFYKILEIGSTGYVEHLISQVSASATTDTNTSPAKTLDGLINGDPDPYSRWAAEVMPQWIQYDLGAVEVISLIAISFYLWNAGRVYQYSIQTSDNAIQWNEVVSNASSSSQEWTFNEFTDLSARYVRITCLSNNQADWAGVWETRIFEPDAPTAVNFSLFTARLNEDNYVVLNWTTSTEQNCREFNITRKEEGRNFVSIGTVPGHGSVSEPHDYTFTDSTIGTGIYSYRLEEIDFQGNIHYSSIVEIEANKPENFKLEQNYPNPFNPKTNIEFSIPVESKVTLKVYGILGNEVVTLVDEKKSQGNYEVEFNAAGLPSGIYFSRIQAIPEGNEGSRFASVKKMILLK